MASRVGKLAACLTLGVAMLSQSARAVPNYATAVLADHPLAFWQLTETGNPNTGILLAQDSSGNGFNGTYGVDSLTALDYTYSPQPGGSPAYLGFAANQGALGCSLGDDLSSVTLPPLNLSSATGGKLTNGVTIAMWIDTVGTPANYTGLLGNRTSAGDAANFGFGGTENSSLMPALGYTWNNNDGATWGWNSGLFPPSGAWALAVLVVQSNQATIYMDYLDPTTSQPVLSSAVNAIAHTSEAFSSGGIFLGSDSAQASATANNVFPGDISDAAVFTNALTSDQVLQLFAAGVGVTGFKPQITGQPQSQFVVSGSPVTFSATGVNGTATMGYQWQLNGTDVNLLADATNFTGATSNILAISSATAADVGSYQLVITNSIGTTYSSTANLTLQAGALVGEWFNGSDASTNLIDVSGYSLAANHDAYVIGGGNYAFTNDVPPGQTGQSILFWDGASGMAISNSSTLDASYDNTFDNVIGNAFTVSCWSRGWPTTWSPWLSKFGETESGWQLRSYGGGPDSAFTVRDSNAGTNTLGNAGGDDMESAFPSEDGNWHFFVGTYNTATGVRSLYVDGQLAAQEINNTPYTLAPSAHLTIGAKDSPPGNSFGNYSTMEMFDARVYNYALTLPQIQAVYTNVPAVVNGQPQNDLAFTGVKAIFTAVIAGSAPLSFQWTLNGTNVNLLPDAGNFTGATNSNTLTVKSVSPEDVGVYQMTVTNLYGSAVSTNVTLSIVPQVLVGEWLTNSSLADHSGHTPAGTHDGYDSAGTGGYAFTNDVPPGWTGESVALDGTTAIAIANSANTDANYTNTYDDALAGNMTVAFWAKGFPGGWIYFMSKNGDSGSPNAGWNIRRDGWYGGNNPCWTMRSPGGTIVLGDTQLTYGDSDDMGTRTMNIDTVSWHHYAGTYNKSTGIRNLYVDGTLVAQGINAGAYNLSPYSHVVIGGIEDSPGGTINNFFTGSFYDVRIYNYDLTSNQIAVISYRPDPLIQVQPQSQTGYIGRKIQFSPTIVGTAPFTNQWQLNGTNLADGAYGGAYITGSTSNVLTIYDLTTSLQGSYKLLVSNSMGNTVSSNATLTVVSVVAPPAGTVVGAWLMGATNLADVSGYSPAGTHDGYGVKGAGVLSSSYSFTNDVPTGETGSNSLWLYAGNTGIAITNSSTLDSNYSNTFDDTISNSFTVTCWAKGSLGAWNSFVTKSGDSGTGWALREGSAGGIGCWTVRGSEPTPPGLPEDMQASVAQTDGQWHFYAGTYDLPSGIRSLYVDGVLEAQHINQVGYTPSTGHVTFGTEDLSPGNNFGNNGYFTGEIYGVQIYKTALSAAQVNYLMPPTPPPTATPVFSRPVINGSQLVLTYSGGTLLGATNILGPWTPVAGATSPYTNNVTAAPQMFFKLQ